jgi:hypothetical protein
MKAAALGVRESALNSAGFFSGLRLSPRSHAALSSGRMRAHGNWSATIIERSDIESCVVMR